MVTDVTDLLPSFERKGEAETMNTWADTSDYIGVGEPKTSVTIGLSVTRPRLVGPYDCSLEELERQAMQSGAIKMKSSNVEEPDVLQ